MKFVTVLFQSSSFFKKRKIPLSQDIKILNRIIVIFFWKALSHKTYTINFTPLKVLVNMQSCGNITWIQLHNNFISLKSMGVHLQSILISSPRKSLSIKVLFLHFYINMVIHNVTFFCFFKLRVEVLRIIYIIAWLDSLFLLIPSCLL